MAEKILGRFEDFDTDLLEVDKVLLDHFELTKPHQRLRSEKGMEFALSLPHGEQLFLGAVVYQDDKCLVVIDLIPEDVLEIRPKGTMQWGRTAFNIGNMHHPAYLFEDCILVPYDSVIERMIKSLGVEYKRARRKLSGVRANVTVQEGHEHSHSPEHGHSHEHSHGER